MTAARQSTPRAAGGKGARPKHVPQRMCVVCRDKTGKRALTRIVRLNDGTVVVDPTGKQNGRGAYLCDKPTCWERAASSDVLGQALRTTISSDTRAYLSAYATDNLPAAVEATEDSEKEVETL